MCQWYEVGMGEFMLSGAITSSSYNPLKPILVLSVCLSMCFSSSPCVAQTETGTSKAIPDSNLPTLNTLKFANRAQCALDSTKPTDSVFVIIDGYNAGKLAYNLAENVGRDPGAMSSQGMKEFRIAVSRLTSVIIKKLLAGALPLLPLNLKTSQLKNYNSLVGACEKKTYCPDLNIYLSKIWENSQGAQKPWQQIDNFSAANFFVTKNKTPVSCFYVKKFSALQQHLHTTVINQVSLTEIAQAYLEKEKYMTTCENADDSLNSRNSILQLDVKVGKQDNFPKVGFDFWNSVKIYLSFAWRYTDVAETVSPEMGELFKSIALEESLMLMPNGCKSIEKPQCDGATLSMNSLRELAKHDGLNVEPVKNLPAGPEQGVVLKGPRGVNDDFLGTRSYDDASAWVHNFRKNFVQIRGSLKNRSQSAIQFLNILAASMSPQELTEYVKPLAFAKDYTAPHRNELYYLCTESRLAGDRRIDFMRTGIDKVKDLTVMQKVFEGSKKSLYELTSYFDAAATGIVGLCDQLEKQNIWNLPGYQVNRWGFSPWARELLNIPTPNPVVPEVEPVSFGPPLLVWNRQSSEGVKDSEPGSVICMSGIDCARKLTKAMVDLYSVAKYADAYLPVSSTVTTPDIFNPYAELNACKVYDPWFVTRRANKRLFSDLMNTALFGWNNVPVYIDVDFKPAKVMSLNQLIKNGTVKFDPKIERSKIEASLLADFGPLVGAPCAISIAPNSDKFFNFYAFNGISLNYCDVKSKGHSTGDTDGSVNSPTPSTRSYCGGCSINFVAAASGAALVTSGASIFNPVKLGIYLFRAIDRFIESQSDQVNIPMSREVDISKVVKTYKEHGSIPKKCMDALALGEGCDL